MSVPGSFDVIVVGGGIGGSAAALRAVQNHMQTLFVTGSKASHTRSRSQWVMNVDNMITVHEGMIRDQVLASLRKGNVSEGLALIDAEHYHVNNRAIIKTTLARLRENYPEQVSILEADCTAVHKTYAGFRAVVGDSEYSAPAVVLSTGIMDEHPQIQVHDKQGNVVESTRPIYPFANRETALYCIRCEGHLAREDAVAVRGSSNAAADVAFMLHERYGNTVYILSHGVPLSVSDENRALCNAYGIELIGDPITDFVAGDVGELCGISFAEHARIEVRFALVAMGIHRVYNDLARQVGAKLLGEQLPPEQRRIAIDYRGETSVPNFFTVGDAAMRTDEPVMMQIYTAQEYAVRAVDSIDFRRRREMRRKALA